VSIYELDVLYHALEHGGGATEAPVELDQQRNRSQRDSGNRRESMNTSAPTTELSIVPSHQDCEHCNGWAHREYASPDGVGRTLTPAQLQVKLQLSENTVYHELQYGSLKTIAFRIGRQWRVSEAALERLMAGGE